MADDADRYQHGEAHDPLVDETEDAREARSAAARLFDIRRVIGGLFVAYGLIVGLMGLFDSTAEIDKAQGVRINLWAGLVMLAFGLAMLGWQWVSPNRPPEPHRGDEP
ncbi:MULTISPECIES: hypothetical protein [Micromonospora]|uniref:Uncharacterized protein n=1 Tax=Micromonospora solifontis TaxID=2487138 RepID=A0ABX9WJ29_9ACTN|nr:MULTISPECIES: hypothetical protein [Micromonospora]NES15576.1 hypothetical protein [Micromonospora sp. PPF5-17B]NES35919.1 hypothetical protein [Micromonospora solifontis]NES56889.1 hypothetical protein [Micromonospora sp. PPF5-6]RNM00204.1 hypothetical protein EFE23_07035 [Micromonospora solifontis]